MGLCWNLCKGYPILPIPWNHSDLHDSDWEEGEDVGVLRVLSARDG